MNLDGQLADSVCTLVANLKRSPCIGDFKLPYSDAAVRDGIPRSLLGPITVVKVLYCDGIREYSSLSVQDKPI